MLRAYKYRIYPTDKQSELINKHIGSCRFLYNLALETKKIAYAGNKVNLSRYDLQVQLKDLKKELTWLTEVNSQSLQVALMNLDAAYLKFFKGLSDFPVFKKKTSRQSFNVPQNVKLIDGKLYIPKFKNGIKIVLHREIKGDIRQATISRAPTGKYFASILVETNTKVNVKKKIKENTTLGIDLGISSFLVTSNGLEINNPKFLKNSISKLRFTQRKFSKHKGKRTKYRLAKIHEKVSNQRKDFLNKISTMLINSHDSIAIENLNIKGMSATCKPKQDENGIYLPNGQSAKSGLNKSILDAGWGMFVNMLEYKAGWKGKNILKIGRFEPSSKMCSTCGNINKELTLKERKWTCVCGEVLNRDVNAAINIKNFALKNHLSVERRLKNRNELPTLVGVMTYEATSPLGKG
jgi:putative transposase